MQFLRQLSMIIPGLSLKLIIGPEVDQLVGGEFGDRNRAQRPSGADGPGGVEGACELCVARRPDGLVARNGITPGIQSYGGYQEPQNHCLLASVNDVNENLPASTVTGMASVCAWPR